MSDFNPFSYFLPEQDDFGENSSGQFIDQSMGQMQTSIINMITSMVSQHNSILTNLAAGILKGMVSTRNSMTRSFNESHDRISDMQGEISKANTDLATIIAIIGGVAAGVGAGAMYAYGEVPTSRDQIMYGFDLMGYGDYMAKTVGNIVNEGWPYPRTPDPDSFRVIVRQAEESAGKVFGIIPAAAAGTEIAIGAGVGLAAALAIYGAIELNIGELAVEMQNLDISVNQGLDTIQGETENFLADSQENLDVLAGQTMSAITGLITNIGGGLKNQYLRQLQNIINQAIAKIPDKGIPKTDPEGLLSFFGPTFLDFGGF